ncbi:MAG: hypothetical protein ACP5JJ_14140 [Anaerolineae bacterium]
MATRSSGKRWRRRRDSCYCCRSAGHGERCDGTLSLADNVKGHIFRATGIFGVDPLFLLQDEVRERRNYLSVLHVMGGGAHTLPA